MDFLNEIAAKLYQGEDGDVVQMVKQALDQGTEPQAILSGGLIAGMNDVGRDFKAGDLYVPEVLCAARAMHAGLDVLRPLLAVSDVPVVGKCVIGTVKGDLHDIGKNLVRMMLEGAGFQVIDLGVDVKPSAFAAAVQEHKPGLVGLSALLTTTMVEMKTTIQAIQQSGLRNSVSIMVGGAPVTEAFAKQIGADAYAPDAATAVEIARRLVG